MGINNANPEISIKTNTEKLDSLIDTALENNAFPGIACGVWIRGTPVFKRYAGYAMPETIQVTENTIFDLASLTKPLATAPLAMIAREEGSLHFDMTLGDYFSAINPVAARIPIQMLLLHTSGLPAIPALQTEFPEALKFSRELACQKLFRLMPDPVLSGQVLYSCTNYIFLGLILEQLYGMSLGQLFKLKIAEKLDLQKSGFAAGIRQNGEPIPFENAAATEYCGWRRRRIRGQVHDESSFCLGGQGGNAGLFSTLDDAATLGSIFLQSGKKKLFSETSRILMTREQTQNCKERRAFGFRLHDNNTADGLLWPRDSFGHTGFTGTSIFFEPHRELMVVILTNRVFYGRDTTLDKIIEFRRAFHSTVWKLFIDRNN